MTDNSMNESEYVERIRRLAIAVRDLQARNAELEGAINQSIAIVGMGCQLPGNAADPEQFWSLLTSRTNAVAEVPASRWSVDAFYDPDPEAYCKMNVRSMAALES